MNNEEIKALLRELAQSADETGAVKSRTVRISLDPEKEPEPEISEVDEEESPKERKTEKNKKNRFGVFLGGLPSAKKKSAEEPEDDFLDDEDETLIEEKEMPQAEMESFSILPKASKEKKTFSFKKQTVSKLKPDAQPEIAEEGLPEKDEAEEVMQALPDDTEEAAAALPEPENKESQTLSWNQIQKRMRAYRKAAGLEPQDEEEDMEPEELDEELDGELEDEFEEEDAETAEEAGEDLPDEEDDSPDATRLTQPEEGQELKVMPQTAVKKQDGPEGKKRKKRGKKVKNVKAPKEGKTKKPSRKAASAAAVVVDAPNFEKDARDFMDIPDEQDEELTKRQAAGKARVDAFFAALQEKGIGKKTLAIILAVLILVIVAAVAVVQIYLNKQKSSRVIADEGLTITVEKEPTEWCTTGQVILGIGTSSPIQTITVDGVNVDFSGTNRAKVTVEATSSMLDVMVVSEESVLTAKVDLRRVDGEDPAVNIYSEEGKTVLDAVDAGSGIEGIWYGEMSDFSEVPMYQLYTEPFEPKQGVLYSYFARDNAGNVTEPVVTDLTPAKSLVLSRNEVALFPGEAGQLSVSPAPADSYVNNVQMTIGNEQIATVDQEGKIVALAEGETDITVTADNINPVTCHVVVRTSASLTITCVGDVTLGDDINFSPLNNFTAVQSMKGNSYFFDNVRDIFKADDITFANLEGTLTAQGSRADKQYAFRGDPSYTQILVDGDIEVVTLANNHSSDYGDISLEDTKNNLTMAGVDYCKGEEIAYEDINGVRVALIGIYALDNGKDHAEELEIAINAAKENDADLIVVAFHWGEESAAKPNREQQTLAHRAVDCGADLVVGHHPHVVQGVEKYAGVYICYSLGNFCFGGNSNPTDKDSMIFQQTFEIMRGGEIQGQEAKVIPCSISSVGDWNNYQPTPAEGDEYTRIIEKINDRSKSFDVKFE